MLTNLLLALDGSSSGHAARALALHLAKAHGARMTGMALVDVDALHVPMPTGIGGAVYAARIEKDAVDGAYEQARHARAKLAEEAAQAHLACEIIHEEGHLREALASAAVGSDLLVIGKCATFTGSHSDRAVSKAVLSFIADNPRPLLLASPKSKAEGPVLVAYDGSMPASRALHMLALLGLAHGRWTRVLTIDGDAAAAKAKAEAAAALLRSHGAGDVEAVGMAGTDPAARIIAAAAEMDAAMVAMGAFGHNGLREAIFGSTTRHLLDKCPAALFVHH